MKQIKIIKINRASLLWFQRFPAAAAKSRQSCPTLCNPTDGSPTGSSVPGILQARILKWVAISFSNAWKWKVKVKLLSVRLLMTPWTTAHQAPPSMGFSRQEYRSGVPLPSPPLGLRCWQTSIKNKSKQNEHPLLGLQSWGVYPPKMGTICP